MYEKQFHKEDLKKYSFLITGGAGFIGSNIVTYLVKYGAGKVRILDNLSTGFLHNIQPFLSLPGVEFVDGDIRDPETCKRACKDIDIVFHQAALGSVPRSIHDPIPTNAVNIDGFLNMLVAAKEQKTERFIYAGSSSTYGDSKKLPKTEDEIGLPLSPYGVTKYVNELYARVFALNYGFKSIGLRYFNVFGPNQSPQGAYAAVVPLFIDGVLNNKKVIIDGDGMQTRDFTFIENVVQANILAAFVQDPQAFNQIYNVAVGERTSVRQMFEILKRIAGSDAEPSYRPARAGDIRDSLADISKIKDFLKYEPTVKLEEGLRVTLEWFKFQNEKADKR